MYSAHENAGGFAPEKHLKSAQNDGHNCFEGLLYKGMQIYLCKTYILGLNGQGFLNVFAVEACVASWIEILYIFSMTMSRQLRLMYHCVKFGKG